jgi:cytochrome c-type biogenesis protein CcmH
MKTAVRRFATAFMVMIAIGWSGAALAVLPDEVLDDPVLEGRARALSSVLRCMVCQNQSIDDSDAPLARDLRLLVRERLVAGDSDGDVMQYLVLRYGDFILLKPPFKWSTALLWAAPAIFLLLGLGLAVSNFRRRSAKGPPPVLDAKEEAALKRMLSDSD